MKKHISRLLSAALVLVMVLGMVPVAMADTPESGSGEPSVQIKTEDSTTLTVGSGDQVHLTAEVTDNGWTVKSYQWSIDSEGKTAVYAAPESGNGGIKTITCTVMFEKGEASCSKNDSFDITVLPKFTGITIAGDSAVAVGGNLQLTIAPVPSSAILPAGTVEWSSNAPGGKVNTSTAGKIKVTAGLGEYSAEKEITVGNEINIAGTTEQISMTVAEAGKSVSAAFRPENAPAMITYSSTNSDIVAVDQDGKLDAKRAGTATIRAMLSLDAGNSNKTNFFLGEQTVLEWNVTVSDGGAITNLAEYVNQKWSNSAAGRSVQLNPKYVGANAENVVLVYSIGSWSTGGKMTVDDKGIVSASSPAAAQVLVAAYPKKADGTADKTGDPLASKTVYVSLYPDNSGMVVNMATGVTSFRFDDAKAINQTTYNSLQHQILSEVLVMNSSRDMIFFDYNDYSGKIGKLSNLYSQLNNSQYVDKLGEVTFSITGGTGGQWKFSYTVKDITEKVILGTGSVTIQFDGGTEVAYATDYTKAVTVLESDFYKAWKASGTTGDLDYVQFTITSGNPANGKMYVTPSSTLQVYEATYTDKFAYGTGAVPSGFYDLGSLTFVPNRSKTTTYTEKIAFTMYGKTSGQVAYGTLVFKVNEKGTSITPRGISFSGKYDSTLSCADWIAAQYKAETNADLGRVIFKLPAAEDGTLYAAVPASGGVSQFARAERLGINTEVYYVKTSGKTQLKDLAFVPAAGKSGTITIQYTAYNQAGTDPVEGTLLFQVVNASKSAVFSDVTMAWAADSVDFLYYEGIAKGSGGKYNPNSNITRGDFMLMLYRAFLADTYGTTAVTDNFPDVVKGTTAYSQETYQAIGIAKKLGIAQGSNGRYNPKANITRQEAMTLIYRTITCREVDRTLRYDSNTYASSLKDFSKVAAYAQSPIRYLVEHGVIKGDSDKNINPLANITRAEMACILHRVITY